MRKTFRGRRPAISYCLTPAGLMAWDAYWSHLNALMEGIKAMGEMKQARWPGDEWAREKAAEALDGPA